jgi:hypothetical protein
MDGSVGPLRLPVNPKTKKDRKHPAVSRKIVVFDGLICMMGEIITGLVSYVETRPVLKKA